MKSVLCLTVALVAFASAAQAREYAVVSRESSLAFTGIYDGEAFDGRYERFTATVAMDTAEPARISITAEIDVASVDTQNDERDETLAGTDFFDIARFPKASFRTIACRGVAPRFSCDAELTIRDHKRPTGFAFTFTERADGRARIEATVALKRLAFDIGRGDWADTALIADDVTVRVQLELTPKP